MTLIDHCLQQLKVWPDERRAVAMSTYHRQLVLLLLVIVMLLEVRLQLLSQVLLEVVQGGRLMILKLVRQVAALRRLACGLGRRG